MSVTFFIGEERLKIKIGLASICLLGLATSHVAANETEVAKTSQDTTTASSSSEQNKSCNKKKTRAEVQTNVAD
ncbi:1,4-beta-N-acetylmuramidase, partial [Staphylococcus aureus]|nr:1,4-beta-N-acetylmuramidase [Staphylococcus aureus]